MAAEERTKKKSRQRTLWREEKEEEKGEKTYTEIDRGV